MEQQLRERLLMQKRDANTGFCKFVKRNYEEWIDAETRPLMSPDIFKHKLFPMLDKGEKVFFILIDNFRLDQWRVVQPLMTEMFDISEDLYTAILPTSTQYALSLIHI